MSTRLNIDNKLFATNEFSEKFSFNKTLSRLYTDLVSVSAELGNVQYTMDNQTITGNTTIPGYVLFNNAPVSAYTTETTHVLSLSSTNQYITHNLSGSFLPTSISIPNLKTPTLSSSDISLSGNVNTFIGQVHLPTGLTVETGTFYVSGNNGLSGDGSFDTTPITGTYNVPFSGEFLESPAIFIQIYDNLETIISGTSYKITPRDRVYQYCISSTQAASFDISIFYKTDFGDIDSVPAGYMVYGGFAVNWCAIGVK